MATVPVTDQTFESEVVKSEIPVVVDFWAEWCGPCKQIGPALEELSDQYDGMVKIVKVNVDENPDSPSKLGVRGRQLAVTKAIALGEIEPPRCTDAPPVREVYEVAGR